VGYKNLGYKERTGRPVGMAAQNKVIGVSLMSSPGDDPRTELRMRNGIFMAPFHPIDQDPTEALHRDLELIEHLDRMGYDEAWIGEHHSAGYEIISSPELFMAAAAERTKRIKLGTGVSSLPYHNPLTLANRIIQLDHQTRGRVMFGVGPGLLPSDAIMMGIDPMVQRDRMMESLEVILRLFNGEVVTAKTDWFNLVEARAHLTPYTQPHPEVCVASSTTPSGGRAAGRYDLGMLCVAATARAGFDALGINWQIACDVAAEHGRRMDRSRLRLVGPVHIAETREKARENVRWGLEKYQSYFMGLNSALLTGDAGDANKGRDPVDVLLESGSAVVGTPDDAIAQIRRLQEQQGAFGAFLQLAHNWATFDNTVKSYQLWAEHVAPVFKRASESRQASFDNTRQRGAELMGRVGEAITAFNTRHADQVAAAKEKVESR
jgi:limonene 1,2-monooxygenase